MTGALLGRMKLTKPQAAKAAELFGLGKSEQTLLNEGAASRYVHAPAGPAHIYRFYELVMVNGPALKALIEGNSATASCRRSTLIWQWTDCLIRKATG